MRWIKSSRKKLSLPDWLSIYRIISAPVSIVLIYLGMRIFLGCFLLVSFATDFFDGFLARRMKIVSQRGAQFDSIGDAITYTVGMVGVIKFETAFVMEHIILIGTTFGLYFLQLFLAYWRYGMPSSFHTYLAKISAFFQAFFIVWLFLVSLEVWLFYVAIILSILETIEEIVLIILFPNWKSDVKGLYWLYFKNKEVVGKSN